MPRVRCIKPSARGAFPSGGINSNHFIFLHHLGVSLHFCFSTVCGAGACGEAVAVDSVHCNEYLIRCGGDKRLLDVDGDGDSTINGDTFHIFLCWAHFPSAGRRAAAVRSRMCFYKHNRMRKKIHSLVWRPFHSIYSRAGNEPRGKAKPKDDFS